MSGLLDGDFSVCDYGISDGNFACLFFVTVAGWCMYHGL